MSSLSRFHTGSISFPTEWAKAKPVVQALLNQTYVSPADWQDLFLTVYKITAWVEDGYSLMLENVIEDIKKHIELASKKINSQEAEHALLPIYIHEWERFYKQTNILPLPFAERETGKNKKTEENVVRWAMLEKWNAEIFQKISPLLLTEAMKLVENERNGHRIDSNLVIGVRESYIGLENESSQKHEAYRTNFERLFFEQTVAYYRGRAAQYMEENGVMNYMRYADKKLEEEKQRAEKYLDVKLSLKSYIEKCVKVLVEEFEESILSECSELISTRNVEMLQCMWRLISKTHHGIDTIMACVDEHIRKEGLNDMKNNAETISTDPEKYVSQLLNMYEKFSSLIQDGFCDDANLLTARDKAFRAVVNDCSVFQIELGRKGKSTSIESKCAELLANYCDLLLRKTQLSKKLTSEQIDEKLTQVLLVLKYLDNKDVFMKFHRAHLSRRLILEMSADMEKEEIMVNKLRESGMPSDLVNKLSRMLQDIELNRDLNVAFKKSLIGTNNNKSASDMINIKVLNGGAWGRGGSERVKFSVPRELEEFVPEIESFHKQHHNGRKLCWMHHWSTGTMTFGTRNGGRYDLDLTTFQMAVLFCWNDRADDKISLETLRLATELPDAELKRTLLSLVAFPKMKHQILLYEGAPPNPSPRDFTDSTLFYVNHEFQLVKNGRPQTRGKINMIGRLQLSLEANVEKEHDNIVVLREFRVQEAIVKILKTRKSITLAQLTTELVEILKPLFVPTRKMIKEQIDWLIENEYMERKPDDLNTFVYLV